MSFGDKKIDTAYDLWKTQTPEDAKDYENMDYSEVDNWKDAVEKAKIPRINWKIIIGQSMGKYILEKKNAGMSKEEILHDILLQCKAKKEFLRGWDWEKIVQNVKIGISARYGELKLYGKI